MSVQVRVVASYWETVLETLRGRAEQAAEESAGAIVASARQRAPRDTGSLAASLYTVGPSGSTYAAAAAEARALNPDAEILPELPRPAGRLYAVGAAAGHAVYQEAGTRFQPAQPFLAPAAAEQAGLFKAKLERIAE